MHIYMRDRGNIDASFLNADYECTHTSYRTVGSKKTALAGSDRLNQLEHSEGKGNKRYRSIVSLILEGPAYIGIDTPIHGEIQGNVIKGVKFSLLPNPERFVTRTF
ncbi:hypothetical protein TWF225_003141 [Orbilia oligospora]|uniref:Uncharacterized protein n=1 Tax=Orbilia oligospora TaxID=2813651 RepID=A0A7C8JZ26_ORBOL|nr:hypothetical protein TWF751_003276 [Orbilia oligospora]KAF3160902.1 hypothetical protein TWF225_003141 [Orbilia oligospora]KAF3242543.1 hypothetical protein TWF128_010507 [Orbilia oligospora]KAF3267278.1 hypothetical protein TWF217_000353 [Orbilia oligospora]KAF3283611.1 hypothetical protein TWF132_010059 [Orbilia oligospora]